MTARTVNRTNLRNRRAVTSKPKFITPAVVSSIAATAADTIQITFNGPVFPAKTPGYTAGAGGAETVSSMTRISDTVIELVFTGDVQAKNLIVQEGDAGIRTVAGGFVPAGSYAVPTFP